MEGIPLNCAASGDGPFRWLEEAPARVRNEELALRSRHGAWKDVVVAYMIHTLGGTCFITATLMSTKAESKRMVETPHHLTRDMISVRQVVLEYSFVRNVELH